MDALTLYMAYRLAIKVPHLLNCEFSDGGRWGGGGMGIFWNHIVFIDVFDRNDSSRMQDVSHIECEHVNLLSTSLYRYIV